MKWANKQTQKEWQTEQIDSPWWLAGWMKTDRPIESERRLDSDAGTPGGQQSSPTHFPWRERPFRLLYVWYQSTSAAATMSTADTFHNRLDQKRRGWFVSASAPTLRREDSGSHLWWINKRSNITSQELMRQRWSSCGGCRWRGRKWQGDSCETHKPADYESVQKCGFLQTQHVCKTQLC